MATPPYFLTLFFCEEEEGVEEGARHASQASAACARIILSVKICVYIQFGKHLMKQTSKSGNKIESSW